MPTNPGTTNLLAWWSHDTGALNSDSHGSNTLSNNGVTAGAAKVGTASGDYERDQSDYQEIASFSGLASLTRHSWQGWLNPESATTTSVQCPFGATSAALTGVVVVMIRSGASSFLRVFFGGGSQYYETATWPAVDNEWMHIAVVVDGSQANASRVQVYRNGSPLSGSVTGTLATSFPAGSVPLRLGANPYFLTNLWDGRLDEIGLFGDALTADEISWLYNSGAGRTYADLAGGGAVPLIVQQHWHQYIIGG